MQGSIIPFAVVSGIPVILLGLGVILGVGWFWVAFCYLTVVTFALDRLGIKTSAAVPQKPDTRAANTLSVVLAITHFGLLAAAVWAVGGPSGLGSAERLLAFFAFGLFFGQVSNSNAHELIHRPSAVLHWLGAWVFISHLFGHHTSAHRQVHHRFVATKKDPNSASMGQGFYRFFIKSWTGSFTDGLKAENKLRQSHKAGFHPYFVYIIGGFGLLGASWVVIGIGGVLAHLAFAGYATSQLLLSDYVQHYGLRRKTGPDGRFEKVGPQHSWDSPHRFSSFLMLNAPRHSDHHAHPSRPYSALEMPEGGPMLPYSLPVMGLIAWSPHLWRRLMDPKVIALPLD